MATRFKSHIKNEIKDPLKEIARDLHLELFPEEYDEIYDSIADARDRRNGINPMSSEYINLTNADRLALGFSEFSVKRDARNDNTFEWVLKKLSDGKEAELREVLEERANRKIKPSIA